MRKNTIIGMICSVIGFILIGVFSSFWVALGVLLMIFANNLEQDFVKRIPLSKVLEKYVRKDDKQ